MSCPLTKFDSSYGGMIYQGSVNVFVSVFKVSPECLPVEPLSLEPTSSPAQGPQFVNVFFLPGASLKFSQFSVKASLHLQHLSRMQISSCYQGSARLATPARQARHARLLSCSPARRLLACSPARQLLQLACYHGYARLQ